MARYTGAKDRLSRREGYDIFSAGAKLTRLAVPPGVHGPKGSRPSSRYGRQLREKQKVKRIYGVMEKQFGRYVEEAFKSRGNTGVKLLTLLEKRLDNVIFRFGFASSRPAARQLVSHGHVKIDGQKVTIPSYRTKVGEVINLASKSEKNPSVKRVLENKEYKLPGWLEKKGLVGKITKEVERTDVTELISEQDIVEYYSR